MFDSTPDQRYVTEFKRKLNRWAVWLPASEISCGDVGIIKKNTFSRQLHVSDLGNIEVPTFTRALTNVFAIGELSQTEISANASAAMAGKLSIEIDVSASSGVFLRAKRLTQTELKSQLLIANELAAQIEQQKLELASEAYVVTSVVSAAQFNALVFPSRQGVVHLSADDDLFSKLALSGISGEFKVDTKAQKPLLAYLGASGPVLINLAKIERPRRSLTARFVEGLQIKSLEVRDNSEPQDDARLVDVRPDDVPWEQVEIS